MDDTLILIRAVHFAAVTAACGTAAFEPLILAPAVGRNTKPTAAYTALAGSLRRMAWIALAVAILSLVAWFLRVASDIVGVPAPELLGSGGGVVSVLTATRFGQVCALRLVLAVILALLLAAPRWLNMRLLVAALLMGTPALVGHAGAAAGIIGSAGLAADGGHLLAAGAWLGGLPALALLLIRTDQPPHGLAIRAVARFSAVGVICVATLLATGLFDAWNLLASPRDLITTVYGRFLLAKIVLFAAMVAIASLNRFRFTPRLPTAPARRALARNSLTEAALGLGAIVAVAALGTLAPTVHGAAHQHAHQPAAIPADAAFAHIHGDAAMADVTITPGRAGPARALIHLAADDMTDFAAKSVRLRLAPPQGAGTAVESPAVYRPEIGAWQADGLDLRVGGIWTVAVTVTPARGEVFILDGPVVIER